MRIALLPSSFLACSRSRRRWTSLDDALTPPHISTLAPTTNWQLLAAMLAPTISAAAALLLLSTKSFVRCAHSLSTDPSPRTTSTILVGTRSSKLAVAQAQKFQSAIQERTRSEGSRAVKVDIVRIDATGDKGEKRTIQQLPLAVMGVDFTGALDEAVLDGRVDVAVHSLKDIPPECRWTVDRKDDAHLVIGAYLGSRVTPLDVLITKNASATSIQTLPHGARVGSASIRRHAQLKASRPDLNVINIRGNVDTRLRALNNDEIDALILAAAGLERLGIIYGDDNIPYEPGDVGKQNMLQNMKYYYNPIPIEIMLPAVGQGVIAITCRNDNAEMLSLLKEVDGHEARIAAITERAYLDTVQRLSPWVGRPPVAGFMRPAEKTWLFNGLLATPDGSQVLHVEDSLENNSCKEETAQRLGKMAGEKVVKMAGNNFLDGYY